MLDRLPTSDEVAVTIVAASRAMGVDPCEILTGRGGNAFAGSFAQARAYAALALVKIFPRCSRTYLSRAVAAESPHAYLSVLQRRADKNELRWWDDQKFEAVLAALIAEAGLERDDPPAEAPDCEPQAVAPPPAATSPRKLSAKVDGYVSLLPPPSPEKKRLRDMLREAVQNTPSPPAD